VWVWSCAPHTWCVCVCEWAVLITLSIDNVGLHGVYVMWLVVVGGLWQLV